MTREDAIKHLENMKWLKGYSNTTVDDIPLGSIIDDIIALLKENEPRVMTLEEYKALAEKPKEECDPVWEEWTGPKSTWTIPNQAYGGYGTSWRCWTARPDQATREATPWERSN